MATGNARDYTLFDPKRRQANKQLAQRVIVSKLGGSIVDNSTNELPTLGTVHVAAYCDTEGAMITTAKEPAAFGAAEWHAKKHIAMVREIPAKRGTSARCAIYICLIKDLLENVTIGRAGVPWLQVGKVALEKHIFHSDDVSAELA